YTDSQYSINCLTKWLSHWISNNWKTASGKAVENQDLINSIRLLLLQRDQIHRNGAQLIYVKGHSGLHGNDEADRLARLGASKPPIHELIL
ncbi:ribonuclease H-like domain-containing protein, partial [Melampsora americana]